jgi:hypothetical protein
MCFLSTQLLVVMDAVKDTRQASIRNKVLKSSLARDRGARVHFFNLNPDGAVQQIGEPE